MTGRAAFVAGLVAVIAFTVWRSQLFTVSRPGERPRPLEVLAESARRPADFDVVLPAVPVGMNHLRDGQGVLLVHYWAPWERDGATQAASLDSLRRLEPFADLRVVLVCFDPFPSVARFVARRRLRLAVLLDTERRLRRALPCPSVPFTYVIDGAGRIAVAQAGEVDWLAERTRAGLANLLSEAPPRRSAPKPCPSPPGSTSRGGGTGRGISGRHGRVKRIQLAGRQCSSSRAVRAHAVVCQL